jgi:hypothetical protein
MIGILTIHRICWESIAKRFGDAIIPLFKKVAKCGFDEYLKKYEEVYNDIDGNQNEVE